MLTYPEICDLAGTPIIATVFRPVLTRHRGDQTGVVAYTMAPGNSTCMARGSVLGVVTFWPGAIMDLAGGEANDNLMGAVWG